MIVGSVDRIRELGYGLLHGRTCIIDVHVLKALRLWRRRSGEAWQLWWYCPRGDRVYMGHCECEGARNVSAKALSV